jgi:FtsH-binding integral membrane protein
MWFLRIASFTALISLAPALLDAGEPRNKVPLMCIVVGLPHLFTLFASRNASAARSVGIAIGSSIVFASVLTIATLSTLIRFFPAEGSSWPWLAAMLAHLVMFMSAQIVRRSDRLNLGVLWRFILLGAVYTIVSIFLIKPIARF